MERVDNLMNIEFSNSIESMFMMRLDEAGELQVTIYITSNYRKTGLNGVCESLNWLL